MGKWVTSNHRTPGIAHNLLLSIDLKRVSQVVNSVTVPSDHYLLIAINHLHRMTCSNKPPH